MSKRKRQVEIFDTTLRDGEQTPGVNFSPEAKLAITQMLLQTVGVDRIEVASALVANPAVSEREQQAVSLITEWARANGLINKVEVLTFLDGGRSIDWAVESGVKVINILCEASMKLAYGKLEHSTKKHIQIIWENVNYAFKKNISRVNLYFEDWSRGRLNSPKHVWSLLNEFATDTSIQRIMLCDTLGVLDPIKVFDFISETIKKYPACTFDFHGHNDRGLATANSLAAARAGVGGIHTTINGLGERAGNTALDEIAVNLKDHGGFKISIKEPSLIEASRVVVAFSGRRIAANKPISGIDVFTDTAGVHSSGKLKGNLYTSKLNPERFGRQDDGAIGKLSGKSGLRRALKKLGMTVQLSLEQESELMRKIADLDKKKTVTRADLLYLLADVLDQPGIKVFKVISCTLVKAHRQKPTASIVVSFRDKEVEVGSNGDGKYNAFMKALLKASRKLGFEVPSLIDYDPHIPPGGDTGALVEAIITWQGKRGEVFQTSGLDTDQDMAAIEATEKAINLSIMAINCLITQHLA